MQRKITVYEKYFKRPFDFCCALAAILVLWPVLLVIAILVRTKLGSPVIFKQSRPGFHGEIFTMYKFRSMTDAKDHHGNHLPDDVRLTRFGATLRNTSLDELPELFNILKGDLSLVGPRPQLVRDMVFMTEEQCRRHSVRPGLSGWAQVNGRNSISWEEKLNYDLEYIDRGITFWGDIKIIFQTVLKAFIKQEGVTEDGAVTAEDFGDYLLRTGQIDESTYQAGQEKAKALLSVANKGV